MKLDKETKLSNNKLFCNFLGIEKYHSIYEVQEEYVIFKNKVKRLDKLKFHKDWNLLMQVVEEIESIDGLSVNISCENCVIYDCVNQKTLYYETGEKMLAVYEACLKYIHFETR